VAGGSEETSAHAREDSDQARVLEISVVIRLVGFTEVVIRGDRALEIEKQLAELLDVRVEELRDYLTGNIGESGNRRTCFRFIRGTHGGHLVRDREGTDILPAGISAP
jgi:hypothetical protein